LIRTQIGDLTLESLNLQAGEVKLLNADQTKQALATPSRP